MNQADLAEASVEAVVADEVVRPPSRRTARLVVFAVIVLCCLLYVGFALTPSSYSCVLQQFGVPNPGLVMGHCQVMRSDEYSVVTPYFQISVLNHFGPVDQFSLYHERLLSFFALPTLGPGLILRPQLWAFHLIPPAYAYSIYWLSLTLSCLASFYFLFRLSKISVGLSACGSLLIFFSQYYQLWWTMNAGAMAVMGWIGVAMLVETTPFRRYLAVTLATALTLFSLLYPPTIIAGGSALFIYVLALHPKRWLNWRFTLAIVGGLATAGGLAVIYYWDLIVLMRNTLYPGLREGAGFPVPAAKLLGVVFPYITTIGSTFFNGPEAVMPGTNPIEIAMIGSWLPILGLTFVRWQSSISILNASRWFLLVVAFGLAVMIVWMLVGIPDPIARLVLWDRVPATRMIFGFGLLFAISTVFMISRLELRFSWCRAGLFAVIVVAAWAGSSGLAREFGTLTLSFARSMLSDASDLAVLLPLVLWALFETWRGRFGGKAGPMSATALALVALTTSMATFGTFNPIQSAKQIFDRPESAKIDAVRAAAAQPHDKPLAVVGWYGAELAGWGLPVVNHVLIYPQLDFFHRLYPDLPTDQFQQAFNRYEHIKIDGSLSAPRLAQADLVALPAASFTIAELCSKSVLPSDFDPQRYLTMWPDVAAAKVDAGKHYLAYGCTEGRAYK